MPDHGRTHKAINVYDENVAVVEGAIADVKRNEGVTSNGEAVARMAAAYDKPVADALSSDIVQEAIRTAKDEEDAVDTDDDAIRLFALAYIGIYPPPPDLRPAPNH